MAHGENQRGAEFGEQLARRLVGQLAVGEAGLRRADHHLRLVHRSPVEEHHDLAQLILRARGAENAARGAKHGDRLGGEGLRSHARQPVDGVLQHARRPVIVFGSDQHEPVSLDHGFLRGLHLVRKALGLDVGIVERPVDFDDLRRRAGRQALDEGIERHAVERRLAKAATEGDDFDWLGHCSVSPRLLVFVSKEAAGYIEAAGRIGNAMPLRDITLDDIESLAVGAWVLGTGGGGSPYLGLLNMRALYKEGHRVQLMPSDDLLDDDWVAAVSNMGAPLVGQERLTDSRTIARAVALMEEHTGAKFRGIMSLEIGGGNCIQPLMAAAHRKRPVIDADMMGRAYPEAQMTSVAVGDLQPCPLTTVDVRGLESVVEKVPTWKWMERVSRKICVEYGSIASTRKAPPPRPEAKQWGIHGTTTKAILIGRAVREAQRTHADPVAAILAVEPGKVLYQGKVRDVERRATEGFLRGRTRLEGSGEWRGAAMRIEFQNEWIVAGLHDRPSA